MFSLVRAYFTRNSTLNLNGRIQNFTTTTTRQRGWKTKYARKQAELRKKQEYARQREVLEKYKDVVPLVECKNPTLNHYKNVTYAKFTPLPLASNGWYHRRSAGDYFTIYDAVPTQEELQDLNNKLQEVPNLLRMEDFGFAKKEESNEALISFSDLGLSPELLKAVERLHIKNPTEIQKRGIPNILKGKNVTLTAETGCGKTLAYLLPLVELISHYKSINARPNDALDSPFVLIIAPSRELASQIYSVANYLTKYVDFIPKLIIGGETGRSIRQHDHSEVDMIIGSLGGVSKFITRGVILTKHLRSVVLDEADTLLDENFSKKLMHLLKKKILVRPKLFLSDPGVQIIMVSATMPETLPDKLYSVLPLDSVEEIITVEHSQVLPKVKQTFIRVSNTMRASLLLDLVKKDVNKGNSVMVFRRRKDILRFSQMSEWSVKAENHDMANAANDPIHHSAMPMMSLPENVSLPRSIEYSVVTPAASNGEASTSSQSPPWSHHPDNHVDRVTNIHGSSSSSTSSFVRSLQCNAPTANEDQPKSPQDTYQSDYENSHEYKPFDLCEVQDNSRDVVSMVGMVREVVRQEMSFDDEDALFAKSIAQMLRRMDRPKRNKTKVRLLQLLSEIDEEDPD